MNHGVDRGGLKRIAADEKGMKAEDLTQQRMLHVTGDEAVNRFLRAQPNEIGCDFNHIGYRAERAIGEIGKSAIIDRVRFLYEMEVARDVTRVEFADFLNDFRLVSRVVEDLSIMENNPVKRRDRHYLDVILGASAGKGEKLIDQKRCGDDRWSGIVNESLIFEDISAASRLVAHLQNRRGITPNLEANRGGQPAKAGTNNNGDGTGGRRSHRPLD